MPGLVALRCSRLAPAQLARRLLGRPSVGPWSLHFRFNPSQFSVEKAKRVLGYRPKRELRGRDAPDGGVAARGRVTRANADMRPRLPKLCNHVVAARLTLGYTARHASLSGNPRLPSQLCRDGLPGPAVDRGGPRRWPTRRPTRTCVCLNSCAVTGEAARQSRQLARQMARANPAVKTDRHRLLRHPGRRDGRGTAERDAGGGQRGAKMSCSR